MRLHHALVQRQPSETTNIAESADAAGLLRRFREQVRKFRTDTTDPWFIETQGLG
jgi:hypothetical protein